MSKTNSTQRNQIGPLGHGPFVMESDNRSLLILQGWAAVLTLTSMTLAAAMAERRRAEAVIEEQKAAVEAEEDFPETLHSNSNGLQTRRPLTTDFTDYPDSRIP